MAEEERIPVIISVADEALERLGEVAQGLQEAGLVLEGVQEALGTVTGRVEASRLPELSRVTGVASVEQAREVYPIQ